MNTGGEKAPIMRRTVITLNVWDLPLWFVKAREERMRRIGAYLARAGADIVCLQESFDVPHRALFERSLGSAYARSGGGGAVRKILGVKTFDRTGGLVTFSRFPVTATRFEPFSRWANAAFSEFFARKGFLVTEMRTPEGPLRVVNVHAHMVSRPFGRRIHLRQIRAVLASLGSLPEMPTILAGDFNEDQMPSDPEFGKLFADAGFAHAGGAAGPFPPTYRKENPLVNQWPNRVRASERDDYIFLNGIAEAGWRVARYAPDVVTPPISDHDPVVLALEKG